MIDAWQRARQPNPGHSQLILAHTRLDVRALNEAARAVRRAADELGPDQVLRTEAGLRAFAEGNRVYFLRNERSLGVKNGTLGTLARIEGNRLTVLLDGPDGAGAGRDVVFDLADYADIGHGYAATIHKSQGATVDQTQVLATPGMDRHQAYVAMSRHRYAAQLHWSEEDFGSPEGLRDRRDRERAKDTTLDYAEPERDPVAAYAEWRGLDPLAPASEIVVQSAPVPVAASMPPATDPSSSGITPAPEAPIPRDRSPLDVILGALRDVAPQAAEPPPEAFTPMAERITAFEARLARERARKQLAPLLPAEPYQAVTNEDVAALVGEPVSLRDHVQPFLDRAYRDPAAAWARLEALMQAHGNEDAVAAILKQQRLGALGRLRGRSGMFASDKASAERLRAEHAAQASPGELAWPREKYRRLGEICRSQLEADRRRETIAVPGLTAAALAAIDSLKHAGAGAVWTIKDTAVDRLTPHQVAEAARVARAWTAIQADPALRDELAAFRKAAEARLGDRPDFWGHPGVGTVHELLQVLTRAEHLAIRHAATEEARAARERAEAQRREAGEARQRAAAKAELEQKPQDLQPNRPRPRHSGPTMG